MHRRSYRKAAAVVVLAMLASGCVQATRHSNTMYFGTNTTFGLKAGASTGEVPEIVVGYDRQEAVVMPLLANTNERAGNHNRLIPCDVSKEAKLIGNAKYAVHPCSFVAFKDGTQDSYSVLASFGAEFAAEAQTSVEASGGLAQYFATGMAAQILAAKGGAALVSTSRAATMSSANDADLAELFPTDSKFARSVPIEFDQPLFKLRALIATTSDAALPGKMKGFEAALQSGVPLGLEAACGTVATCLAKVEQRKALLQTSTNFKAAVEGWQEY